MENPQIRPVDCIENGVHKQTNLVIYRNENNFFHRENGPAYYYEDGFLIEYYINGQFHRLDGAAQAFRDGTKGYYINGVNYSPLDYLKYIQENHPEHFPKVFAEVMSNIS